MTTKTLAGIEIEDADFANNQGEFVKGGQVFFRCNILTTPCTLDGKLHAYLDDSAGRRIVHLGRVMTREERMEVMYCGCC